MRIAVMGSGGVGGYFGGRLAMAGHDVCFIARGEHLRAIRQNGLQVESINGDFVVFPAEAKDDLENVGTVELAIVSVKTWQLSEAAQQMRPLVGPETIVLPLLNGVEAADELAKALPPAQIIGGLCRIIAYVEAPGRIRHSGMEPSLVFGELDSRRSERVKTLKDALDRAGIQAEIASDVRAALWRKFMLISTWSGIGAITHAPIGVWRNITGTRAMAEASLRETLAVAREHGVALSDELVADSMRFFDELAPDGTTSMQRDIQEGRPSELESQSGAVVRLGSEAGVPTPTHSFFYYGLIPRERMARSEGSI